MANEVFWDTHGFFALLSKDDTKHLKVAKLLRSLANKDALSVTTDWVVGETCTLFMARKHSHMIPKFLAILENSNAVKIIHVDIKLFEQSKAFIKKHLDQNYSFTDCTSFMVMKQYSLQKAVTEDPHFRKAGFTPLL